MNHEMIQEKLFALYDGPLTEQERKVVEGHLSQCRQCRRALAEWKALSQRLFPKIAFSEASEDIFTLGVLRQLEPYRPAEVFWTRPLFKWAVPALGAAALIAWFFLSSLNTGAGLVNEPAEAAFTFAGAGGGYTQSGFVPVSYPGP
ncbi:MAG TPA: zf-HC2 domain-containing protein [bacterium]|nr:zf-HC2 domain-containing protein [bacterium]